MGNYVKKYKIILIIIKNITLYFYELGKLVKFSHTIFLFPFAMASIILASRSITTINSLTFLWIIIALISSRNAAMIMNRIADLHYDTLNPRTNNRSLVTGKITKKQAWYWLIINCIIFIITCYFINKICFILSPISLIWIISYSYSKRFTKFSHFWLGISVALAPLGAWIAITNTLYWGAIILATATATWVAGFDIIYACEDIIFDQTQNLKSLPATIGFKYAIKISWGLHFITLINFYLIALAFNLGIIYIIGITLIGIILLIDHLLIYLKKININFFLLNAIISINFFLFLFIDLTKKYLIF